MNRPGAERRALEALDAALRWPRTERAERLARTAAQDPDLARRLGGLLEADDRASLALPTDPPSGGERSPSPPPPERIGVFRLAELLGEGGMGSVWRGERDDGLFAQQVAVKLVRPGLFAASALRQFEVERRVLARLRHPNIAQLYDGGADAEGRAWFVMELVEGRRLADHVAAQGLSLRQRVELMLPVCAAVRHAHAALVVHADIKPGNIVVDAEGRPKLLDFGIARSLEDAEEAGGGQGLTAPYASPQRRAGERAAPGDDVYALGAVLWELACGAPPPDAPPPPLGPDAPRELAAVIAKAAAAEPSARYDGAGALADDLRRWLEGRPVQALPERPLRSARLFLRRRPWVSAAAAAALAGLVVALAVITGLYQRSERERGEADRRFAQARGMAHYMLFDLFDRLSDAPGTLSVRRELAGRAKDYLDDLAAAPRAPVEVRAEAAVGYMQLAGVQGMFVAGQLGEGGRGRTPLEQAAALLAAAPPQVRRDPHWLHADGRLKLFQGFAADEQGAGAATARRLLRESVTELLRAEAALPDDPEVGIDRWQAQLTLADVVGSAGDGAGDIAIARQALDAYAARRAVLDRHPKTPLFLARSYTRIGEGFAVGDDNRQAAVNFARALSILEAEDRRRPRRTRTLFEIMQGRWNLANALRPLGRNDEALKQYEQAIAAGRARLLIEPEHDSLQRLATLIESARAELLSRLGRHAEAVAAVHESQERRAGLLAEKPGDQVAWRNYLVGLVPEARVEAAGGRRALACAHYREAQRGFARYRTRFSLSRTVLVNEVADADAAASRCR